MSVTPRAGRQRIQTALSTGDRPAGDESGPDCAAARKPATGNREETAHHARRNETLPAYHLRWPEPKAIEDAFQPIISPINIQPGQRPNPIPY